MLPLLESMLRELGREGITANPPDEEDLARFVATLGPGDIPGLIRAIKASDEDLASGAAQALATDEVQDLLDEASIRVDALNALVKRYELELRVSDPDAFWLRSQLIATIVALSTVDLEDEDRLRIYSALHELREPDEVIRLTLNCALGLLGGDIRASDLQSGGP